MSASIQQRLLSVRRLFTANEAKGNLSVPSVTDKRAENMAHSINKTEVWDVAFNLKATIEEKLVWF